MGNFDFTTPPSRANYDTEAARRFFESAGKMRSVAAGKVLFTENSKASALLFQKDKMYYLLEGAVDLTVNNNPVGMARAGDVFGEMTLITGMPRTATAKTQRDCRLIELDKDQLQSALSSSPEFGLLLMSIMISRLRDIIGQLGAKGGLNNDEMLKDSAIFDKKTLDKLAEELDTSACIRYPADKTIIQEGQGGVLMYVVLQGTVEIAIQNSVVGRIGPGGLFGEMALISRGERLASAKATTDCVLLSINRNLFLDLVRSNPKFVLSLLDAVGNRARFIASSLG